MKRHFVFVSIAAIAMRAEREQGDSRQTEYDEQDQRADVDGAAALRSLAGH